MTALCAASERRVTIDSSNFWRTNGSGISGIFCVSGRSSPSTSRRGDRPLLNGEQALSGLAVQDVDEAIFAGLGDGVDELAFVTNRDEQRGGWEVEIPDIMLDCLEVPLALARRCIQTKDRVREQVVAVTIGAVEVECRRARGNEHESALLSTTRPAQLFAPPECFHASLGHVS